MPAERTQRRAEHEDFVWSLEPTIAPDAHNDLSDLPPLVDAPPPSQFVLFSPDEPTTPRKTHSKKKPENHIPRPPNAFILFRSSFIKSQAVSTEVETNHSTLSKIIGLTWQNLPDAERKVWHSKAKEALEEHKRKFPKYSFRPSQPSKGGGKRKVREVEQKDPERCKMIAQLLVQGKKGTELDKAIMEFDKNHTPAFVARFEAPITARSYRRSSSAPVPDTEHRRNSQSFFQVFNSVPSTPKKVRARSRMPSPVKESFSGVPSPSPSLKREPSFDFSTFSFDSCSSPTQTLYDSGDAVDPLSLPAGTGGFNPLVGIDMADQCQEIINSYSNHLSIDTSSHLSIDTSSHQSINTNSHLSIDTNFVPSGTTGTESWCSSPVDFESPLCTPTTAHFTPAAFDAPASGQEFNFDFAFDFPMPIQEKPHPAMLMQEKPLPSQFSHFPVYQQGHGMLSEQHLSFADLELQGSFAVQHVPAAQFDLDFGLFSGQF